MTVETGLNLVWASCATAALVVFAVCEWRRRATFADRCRRGLAVFVATVALFPTVSASDDFVRFEVLQTVSPARSQVIGQITTNSNDGPGLYLARLSDALENSQISSVCWLLATLCFFALVGVRFERGRDRSLPSFASRAPPFAFPPV